MCVASVRFFYPDVCVRLLGGGHLQRGLADELRRYWDVSVADLPERDYGWGFVKLEPLFRPVAERFLVLDSDTIIAGPVLQLAARRDEDFIVDDEDQRPDAVKSIYFDTTKARQEGKPLNDPAFLFNTGQWFGKTGVVCRNDFDGLVDWAFPRRLRRPSVFKNGEQGILNYVLNEQWRSGKARIARIPLMRWPPYGMQQLDAHAISMKASPPLVVHWAGIKKVRQRDMVGADVLAFFENEYYKRLPAGTSRRILAGSQYVLSAWSHRAHSRARLAFQRSTNTEAR